MKKIIGQIIEEQVRASKMDIVEFARQINRERSNVYNIFKRDNIDIKLLKEIGHVLNYDFFQHLIEPETVEKIKLSDSIKKSRILIELEMSEDEIMQIGFEEKVLKILNKK